VIVPAQPRIFSRSAPPILFVLPAQPIAPSEAVRPVLPRHSLLAATNATRKIVSVQRGDSLWKLAKQNLGRGNRRPELLAANPGIADANQIRVGVQLNLPEAPATPRSKRVAASTAKLTLKIHRGDTLWSLAKANLGHSSAWHCLAAANPSVSDPNRIYENQELVVPAGCSP
jgi:nucleoid-associated protein YgaU